MRSHHQHWPESQPHKYCDCKCWSEASILQVMIYLRMPKAVPPSPCCKPWEWWSTLHFLDESTYPTIGKKLDKIQSKAAHSSGTSSVTLNIHPLCVQYTVTTVCIIHKIHCSYSHGLVYSTSQTHNLCIQGQKQLLFFTANGTLAKRRKNEKCYVGTDLHFLIGILFIWSAGTEGFDCILNVSHWREMLENFNMFFFLKKHVLGISEPVPLMMKGNSCTEVTLQFVYD